ncbi:3'(2'),5'-bisphosphate nucleotidase CysQ [Sphingomonas donggukensis]|uniref:3'(2'),5'-bisphosphate nucleotidase CysQ n=1 Tax=Sphingomonas donggukensis TaxID=2949093 RepID=A0ABY4TWY9_9SPHN|nr:3'(2'),5'-bisphosphate nucleotidase CysQ [Sphingomonas donggukensis]URW76934.1 3'(2'),5'-bisphosphate nucleotidase CysQ [Sphingomonas donggukensis]
MTDAALARSIAEEAGRLLLSIRHSGATGRALGDAGDRAANTLILDRLRAARPGEFILSEESEDDPARCSARRCWVVDPLDGTAEYAAGRGDWAVHVGLSIDGVPAAGAVALPARGLVFDTEACAAAPPARVPPRIVVSRTRPPAEAVLLAERLGGELVPMGSAGAKAMAVVMGEADIYIHAGGQYAWDNCAPAAVALAAGLHVSRLDGTPLTYNRRETWLPDLLICSPAVAGTILAVLAEGGEG